jgi:predicted ester cyclase
MNNLTNKEVVANFFEIYNHQDYNEAYKYFAPNYHDRGLPHVKSVEDAIEILKSVHKAFPDIKVVIDDLIEENDKVVFRGHFTATHLGEFAGLAPSGVKVDFEALEIFRVENQKIVESWGYWPYALIVSEIKGLERPYQ